MSNIRQSEASAMLENSKYTETKKNGNFFSSQ